MGSDPQLSCSDAYDTFVRVRCRTRSRFIFLGECKLLGYWFGKQS